MKWICQAPEEAAASIITLVTSSSLPGRQPNAPQASSAREIGEKHTFAIGSMANAMVSTSTKIGGRWTNKVAKFVMDLTIQVEQLERRWGLQTTGRMACRLLET